MFLLYITALLPVGVIKDDDNGGLEAEPTPLPRRAKLVGFVSISGATFSKNGVYMSTPVHPVATPLRTHNITAAYISIH